MLSLESGNCIFKHCLWNRGDEGVLKVTQSSLGICEYLGNILLTRLLDSAKFKIMLFPLGVEVENNL